MDKKEISLHHAENLLKPAEYNHSVNEVNADLIGRMFETEMLSDWLCVSEQAHTDRKDKVDEIIESWIPEFEKNQLLINAITDYGNDMRGLGFREGVNIALNFIIQGMRFPTLN